MRGFNEARTFILAHELGHIYHQHPGYIGVAPETARQNEIEADQFALAILRRSGTMSGGIFNYFFWHAHHVPNRWDYTTEEKWQEELIKQKHPLTEERLYAIAADLEKHVDEYAKWQTHLTNPRTLIFSIASDVAQIAKNMKDIEYQEATRLAIVTARLQDLAPRCPHRVPTTQVYQPFEGDYDVQWTYHYSSINIPDDVFSVQVTLQRTGSQVKGDFNFGVGVGHRNVSRIMRHESEIK